MIRRDKSEKTITLYCDKCGRPSADCAIRYCPHPAVLRWYGRDEMVKICYYCCQKCRFAEKVGLSPGLGCAYKNE